MASLIANRFKDNAIESYLSGKTIRAVLLNPSHVPNADQNTWGDISANECTDSLGNYVSGGITVTGATFTQDDTSDRGVFTCDAVEVDPVTIPNARWLVFLVWNSGTPASSEIIAHHDLGATQVITNGPFSWTPNASGLLYAA